jgi:hypothetical protein
MSADMRWATVLASLGRTLSSSPSFASRSVSSNDCSLPLSPSLHLSRFVSVSVCASLPLVTPLPRLLLSFFPCVSVCP